MAEVSERREQVRKVSAGGTRRKVESFVWFPPSVSCSVSALSCRGTATVSVSMSVWGGVCVCVCVCVGGGVCERQRE